MIAVDDRLNTSVCSSAEEEEAGDADHDISNERKSPVVEIVVFVDTEPGETDEYVTEPTIESIKVVCQSCVLSFGVVAFQRARSLTCQTVN